MKKWMPLSIVLLVVGVLAGFLSACSSGDKKPPLDQIGMVGQAVCTAGAPCATEGLSCLNSVTNTSYVCIGGLYQAASPSSTCVEGAACPVSGALCITSCGTVLGCNASHVKAKIIPAQPSCTDSGTGTDASGTGGTSGTGGATADASGTGGAISSGGAASGGTDAGSAGNCVTMNDDMLCNATNVEGDMICSGALTCHCNFWAHTATVAGNPCPSGAGGATGTGGTAGTGGVAATGGTTSTGGATGSGGVASTGGTTGTGGVAATGGTTSTGGSASDAGVMLCFIGNACSPNSSAPLEQICWNNANYVDILRCCGGSLMVSSLNGSCPDAGGAGTGGSTGAGGATSTGGATATGGTAGTGGVAATGGTTSTGGTAGTGGAGGAGPMLQIAVTPKNALSGSPALWADYDDAANVHHGWTTIVPTPTAVVGTTYIFVTNLGSGAHNIVFNAQEPVAASKVGFCWEYDRSSNVPCGGNGSNPGTVVATMTVSGTVVPQGTPISNEQPPGNVLFFNGVIPMVP